MFLLQTVTGIGQRLGLTFLYEIGDIALIPGVYKVEATTNFVNCTGIQTNVFNSGVLIPAPRIRGNM